VPTPNLHGLPSEGPIFIVMNARSGRTDADTRENAIREILTPAGRNYRIWRISNAGELGAAAREAVQLAQKEGGIVVAAGGDGTINTVAQEVLGSGCHFGVLPQGTFNYFCRSHGIPLDIREAAAVLVNGVVRPVQVGLLNERIFLVNASLGLYPDLLETREYHKGKFGRSRLVAMVSALVTLFRPPPKLLLALEEGGEKNVLRATTLVVDNNALQLMEIGAPEAEDVQRGQLAAVVVKADGVLQMLALALRALLGKLIEASSVYSFSFTSITVNLMRQIRIKVATDGEVCWMTAPLSFRVAPRPLMVVVPAPAPQDEE
jgi:diacylglycerol kinase family enzyme